MALDFSHVAIDVLLVSLDEAKQHLRLTGTAHDADVTAKLVAAQYQIVAKLGPAADATWTEETVPPAIAHAILILLDAFYERRGGDEANDTLHKALEVIELLLAPFKDPTLV